MKLVFADTLYWIAITNPKDAWRKPAIAAKQSLGPCVLVTTDGVLTEFLAALSSGGPRLRESAVKIVDLILKDHNVRVLPQTRDRFLKALGRYRDRLDKEYSLVDCDSMNGMDEEKITDALTNDHHFTQESFTVLIKEDLAK